MKKSSNINKWHVAVLIAALLAAAAITTAVINFKDMPENATFVIILDGFSSDYLDRMPFLLNFAQSSRANASAVTVMPSITPAAHASILTGVDPHVHGIVDYNVKMLKAPTIMDYLRQRGIRTCFIAVKGGLDFLVSNADFGIDSTKLDFDRMNASDIDAKTLLKALALKHEGTCLLIVMNLPAADLLGHRYGPQSMEISQHLVFLDNMLREFLQKADARSGNTVIITSDHGMCQGASGGYHGTSESCAMKVPIIVSSEGIRKGVNEQLSSVKDVYTLAKEAYQ